MIEKTCSGRTRTYERPTKNEFNNVKIIKMKKASRPLSDEELLESEKRDLKRKYPHWPDYHIEKMAQRNFSFRKEMMELKR